MFRFRRVIAFSAYYGLFLVRDYTTDTVVVSRLFFGFLGKFLELACPETIF